MRYVIHPYLRKDLIEGGCLQTLLLQSLSQLCDLQVASEQSAFTRADKT